MKLYEFKLRTAEYRISNRRISKGGFASPSHFCKIDRIHSFDIRHSTFIIRYSIFAFQSFFFWSNWPLRGRRLGWHLKPERRSKKTKLSSTWYQITSSH